MSGEDLKSRPDGPVGARFIGDAGEVTVVMKVYWRSGMGKEPPSQRDIENKISDQLLALPRLDEGADWDVSATSIPGDES